MLVYGMAGTWYVTKNMIEMKYKKQSLLKRVRGYNTNTLKQQLTKLQKLLNSVKERPSPAGRIAGN